MSKPFLIVNIIDGELGVIKERDTWEEAVDVAVDMAVEQEYSDPDGRKPSKKKIQAIRKEIEEDGDFAGSGFRTHIAQSNDD